MKNFLQVLAVGVVLVAIDLLGTYRMMVTNRAIGAKIIGNQQRVLGRLQEVETRLNIVP